MNDNINGGNKIGVIDGAPILEVTEVVVERGTPISVVECPMCESEHRHGFEEGIGAMISRMSIPSHRASHCSEGGPYGYFLVYTPNTNGIVFSEEIGGWIIDE